MLQQQGCGVLALPNGVYVLCYNPNKRLYIVRLIFAILFSSAAFADAPSALIPATFYVRKNSALSDTASGACHYPSFSHFLFAFQKIVLMGSVFGYYFLLIVSLKRVSDTRWIPHCVHLTIFIVGQNVSIDMGSHFSRSVDGNNGRQRILLGGSLQHAQTSSRQPSLRKFSFHVYSLSSSCTCSCLTRYCFRV
jgi:hypothetical protein